MVPCKYSFHRDFPESDPYFDHCDETSDTVLQQGWRAVKWACHSQNSWNSHRAEVLQLRPAAFQVCPFEKPSPIQESMGIHLSSASFICFWEADLGKCAEVSRGRMSKMSRRAATGVSSTGLPALPHLLEFLIAPTPQRLLTKSQVPPVRRILTGHLG